MKKILYILLLLLTFTAIVQAGTNYTAPLYSGINTKVFQNGNLPGSTYDGITFIGISEESTSVTIGDGQGATLPYLPDSIVYIDNTSLDDGVTLLKRRALFKIDMQTLGIPESSMIRSAKIRLARLANSGDVYSNIRIFRLLRDFDNTATWMERKTDAGDSTAWLTPGAQDTSGAWPSYVAYHSGQTYTVSLTAALGNKLPWNVVLNTPNTSMPKYASTSGNFYYPIGPDSCYSGYVQVQQQDRIEYTDLVQPILNNDSNGFVDIDITKYFQFWYSGRWMNCGSLLIPNHDLGWQNCKFLSNSTLDVNLRPQLILEYISFKKTNNRQSKVGMSNGL